MCNIVNYFSSQNKLFWNIVLVGKEQSSRNFTQTNLELGAG